MIGVFQRLEELKPAILFNHDRKTLILHIYNLVLLSIERDGSEELITNPDEIKNIFLFDKSGR